MYRREFLQKATAGAAVLTWPQMPSFAKEVGMGIVVHSYWSRWNSKTPSTTYPAFTNAIDLLDHCHQIGAGGAQVIISDWTPEYAKQVRTKREQLGLYLEGSMGLPKKSEDLAKFEQTVKNAKDAGVNVIRTVCSGGRRYETYHSPEAFQELTKNALASLRLVEPVMRKHKVKLAVENHKDWRAKEMASLIKEINSEWIGITLDFGNSISLLEDPMEVAQTLAPYVFTTHIKDMAVEEYPDGFLLSEVPLGDGILDLPAMIAVCRKHNPSVTFNLEMITRDPLEIPCLKKEYWETFETVPGSDLARTLRMVREHKPKKGLPRVAQLTAEDRLATEEGNIVACLTYSKNRIGL